ncbi:MAG: transposase [Planctomycetales bacterium]|nr:transposase [Planctomycetales bacterium]
MVYAKPPWNGPEQVEQVLKHLARYTHRVAISNQRLLLIDDEQVTFRYKDYRQQHRQRTMTLAATEFILNDGRSTAWFCADSVFRITEQSRINDPTHFIALHSHQPIRIARPRPTRSFRTAPPTCSISTSPTSQHPKSSLSIRKEA